MTEYQSALADFASRQVERAAQADVELQHLKQAVIPPLREAGIATVEVRFDGCGDSGAVEECTCYSAANAAVACPDVSVEPFRDQGSETPDEADPPTLAAALESLTYLALERHHPGWEINDGAGGELFIDVVAASFVLECGLRYTSTEDHLTEL